MYPPVFSQVTGNGEGLPTVLADIGPLARVRPHVFLQVTAGRPAFTAHRAHVRPLPGVPPHVHVEASECSEVFGAVGAAVGPLTSVCPQVALQAIAGLEALAALRAQEAALSGVGRPVGLQAGERAVRLAAQVALVRAEGVCALVDTKLGHPWRQTFKHMFNLLWEKETHIMDVSQYGSGSPRNVFITSVQSAQHRNKKQGLDAGLIRCI